MKTLACRIGLRRSGKAIVVIAILTLYSTACGVSPTGIVITPTSQILPANPKPPTSLPTFPPLTKTPGATPIPFIGAETPTLLPTSTWKTGWVDFINGYYGYAISLPPAAVVTKKEKIDNVQAELPAGMEPGEYYGRLNRTYPPGMCVSVNYQSVYLNISVQDSLGGALAKPCGRIKLGDSDPVLTEEEVFVGQVPYRATHAIIYENDAPDAKLLEEFYYVDMGAGGLIYFGGEWKDQSAYDQYLRDKAILFEILRSYRSVPKTELFCPALTSTRLKAGGFAFVSTKLPLSYLQISGKNLRNGPGINHDLIGSIETGKAMELIEGPVCNNSLQWWKVRVFETRLVGWIPESDYLTPEGYHESSWLIACESKENCGKP